MRFARCTGDLQSLSLVDIRVIALARTYEVLYYGKDHLRDFPPPSKEGKDRVKEVSRLPGWGAQGGCWEELDKLNEEELAAAEAALAGSAMQSRILSSGVEGLQLDDGNGSAVALKDSPIDRYYADEVNREDNDADHRQLSDAYGDRGSDGCSAEEEMERAELDRVNEDGNDAEALQSHDVVEFRIIEDEIDAENGTGANDGDWEVAMKTKNKARKARRKAHRQAERKAAEVESEHETKSSVDDTTLSTSDRNRGSSYDVDTSHPHHMGAMMYQEAQHRQEYDFVAEDVLKKPDDDEKKEEEANKGADDDTDRDSNISEEQSMLEALASSALQTNSESLVSCVTADFAMQNVLLQMGLKLVSPKLGFHIKSVTRWVLRCSACFQVTKEIGRVFCPQCGNSTLEKVMVTVGPDGTEQYGVRKKHILRGTKFPLPKPKGGRASELILCEDQLLTKQHLLRAHLKKEQALKDALDPFSPEYNLHTWHQAATMSKGKLGTSALMAGWKRNPNERKHVATNRRRK